MTQNPSFTNVAHRWMGYLDINSSLLMSQFESLTNQMWVTSTPLSNSVQVMSETDHPLSQSENSVWKKYFTLENIS
ncbi:hypothetical protein HMI55_002840 [Coelomomyces lativittatus]|nr:hypothetical protein HMI55_002840 [Coelomomyces lativittatus]